MGYAPYWNTTRFIAFSYSEDSLFLFEMFQDTIIRAEHHYAKRQACEILRKP